MMRFRRRLPLWLSVSLALVIALSALPGDTQTTQPAPFRITHTIDKGAQTQVTVTGRVFNEARADAIDVYVTAEALDAAGKIMASGVSYVGTVPAGNSSAFIIKVPAARTAANFRVSVSGYRFGFAIQS